MTKLVLMYHCARCQKVFPVPVQEPAGGSNTRDPVSGNEITDTKEIARRIMLSMFPSGNGQFAKNQAHDCDESKRKAEAEVLRSGLPGLVLVTEPKIAFGLATFVGIEEAP